ncbi:MAG: preprotein translocase subunit SecG [Anaerolineae bacterium]|nr:preprotein translocase subunit SecG [Anaerolineae bacterium]
MSTYLNIVQIILGVALIAIILVQTRQSDLGAVFGGAGTTVQRTRRGFERTLFIVTIALSVVFFLIVMISAIVATGTAA